MSELELVTRAEAEALSKIGHDLYEEGDVPGLSVRAYRAGFRDGSVVPARVFRPGDPEPGPEIRALLDCDSDVWHRRGDGWACMTGWNGDLLFGELVVECGPLVACHPRPDIDEAVRADDERRAAEQATGGAQ